MPFGTRLRAAGGVQDPRPRHPRDPGMAGQPRHDVAQALMEIGNQQALDAWAACTSRPDNTMGSVYGTAETLLDVYGDPVVAASADGCDLDIDELLTGANNTLYLYAPASEQERL